MKDMPMFTTKNGIASLTLREIPYSAKAYIRIQTAVDSKSLLEECMDFCRAVGAREVFATGDMFLAQYPVHSQIMQMVACKQCLEATTAQAVPLTASKMATFREIYNRKMAAVPNAAYMTLQDADKLLADREGFFVEEKGKILGIGIAGEGTVKMLAATVPGAGKAVLCALAATLSEQEIFLEVATQNRKAMVLYERLGFQIREYVATWYKIL